MDPIQGQHPPAEHVRTATSTCHLSPLLFLPMTLGKLRVPVCCIPKSPHEDQARGTSIMENIDASKPNVFTPACVAWEQASLAAHPHSHRSHQLTAMGETRCHRHLRPPSDPARPAKLHAQRSHHQHATGQPLPGSSNALGSTASRLSRQHLEH